MFSRAAKWFREQGFPVFHAQLLKDLEVQYPQVMLIDSTVLWSILYDSQAKWGVSTRYHWLKGYKPHLCTTVERIILSHVLTTANRNDAAVAPELLVSLQQWISNLYWAMPRMTEKRFDKQPNKQESY